MVCTYGSFARDLTALNAGVTIAAVPGGSLSSGQSLFMAVQIRTRGGLTLHTAPVQVVTTEVNTAIAVTITEAAIAPGDFPMELVISGAAVNSAAAMVRLASWRFRDGRTITYPGVGAVLYPGEGLLRNLPHTVTLTRDAHIALVAPAITAVSLPTGADLIQGMLREVAMTTEVVRYDAEATSGLYPAATGYWRLHLPGFTPITNGAFSTYYGASADLEGGSDRLVTELGPGQALNLPAYKFDGSPQDPPLILFLNNGFEGGGGSPLPKGGSLAIQIKMNDSDVSAAFAGRISLQLLGYCDRASGALDTSVAGSAVVWQPGTNAVVLPEDLPMGSAAVYSVALVARKDEILNSRDLNASALADGAVLTTLLYFEGLLGRPSDLWFFLGDVIFAIADRMILVPLVNGLRRLGGVALVKGFGTPLVGTYLVDSVLENTAGQKAAISGALGGAIIMRTAAEPLGDTEALRATVSTAPGTQAPSEWSAAFSLTTGNQTIAIAVTSPSAVRADYPDALLAGNAQGEFNVPYFRIFVEAPGPIVYELTAPAVVSPTGTTTVNIGALTELSAASLPTQADASFGLFGYGSISGAAAGGGALAVGSYRVAIANLYPSPNPEVTAIAHGDIEVLEASVSDLLSQSLPYTRLTASFVQPGVGVAVLVQVDNGRNFAVGGSVIVNTSGDVFQGFYKVTDKTNTTLTLERQELAGSVIAGVSVPASGFVLLAGVRGPLGLQGLPGRTVLSGAGAPANGLGTDEDFYIDTTAKAIYGPKTVGAWGGATQLIGPTGAAGNTILSGPGAPAAGLGVDGNFYIDTTAKAIYGPKTAGAWGSATALRGADGQPGLGIRYAYSSTAAAPPAAGELRLNNTAYALVTEIYASETARTSVGVAPVLDNLTGGSVILIFDEFSDGAYAFYRLVSQVDSGTYRTLTVTHLASAGTLSANVSFGFSIAGPQGGTGPSGTVSAASALILQEQLSAPATGLDEIGLINVGNTLQWREESGGDIYSVAQRELKENAQLGITYTVTIGDAFKGVTLDNASAITLTIPPNSSVAIPVSTQILIGQKGAGVVTIAPSAGVTINGGTANLALSGQWAMATLWKIGTDSWWVAGGLT